MYVRHDVRHRSREKQLLIAAALLLDASRRVGELLVEAPQLFVGDRQLLVGESELVVRRLARLAIGHHVAHPRA